MSEIPVPRDPGQDEDLPGTPAGPGDRPSLGSPDWRLVPQSPDWPEWMDDDAYADDEDPGDPDEYEDPDNAPPPGLDDAQLAALLAEAREITADQARAAELAARLGHTAVLAAVGAAVTGRRGPGMPGSAQSFPGEYASPAAGFGTGKPLDTAPGCATLASFLEEAAGEDDRYRGASDDELQGVVCGWDRVEAYASARKQAAVAEMIRRRPAPGAAVQGPAEMLPAAEQRPGPDAQSRRWQPGRPWPGRVWPRRSSRATGPGPRRPAARRDPAGLRGPGHPHHPRHHHPGPREPTR